MFSYKMSYDMIRYHTSDNVHDLYLQYRRHYTYDIVRLSGHATSYTICLDTET